MEKATNDIPSNAGQSHPARSPLNLDDALTRFEQGYVKNILQLTQGDLNAAARLLEVTPDALTRKMAEYQTDSSNGGNSRIEPSEKQ